MLGSYGKSKRLTFLAVSGGRFAPGTEHVLRHLSCRKRFRPHTAALAPARGSAWAVYPSWLHDMRLPLTLGRYRPQTVFFAPRKLCLAKPDLLPYIVTYRRLAGQ